MNNSKKNDKPLIIALTGGIGTGKSEALKFFATLGAITISADQIAKEVVASGTEGLLKIKERFGADVIMPSGELDRKKLANIVFNSDVERKALEQITHPLIRSRSSQLIAEAINLEPPPRVIVYEIPLYFESGLKYPEIDFVLVVSATPEVALKRVIARGLSSTDAKSRMAAQLPIADKVAKADFIIDNSSDLGTLANEVKLIYDKLCNELESKKANK